MRGILHDSRPFAPVAVCALILIVLACLSVPAPAAEIPALGVRAHSAAPPDTGAPPVAGDSFGWLWTFLENTLHSRARMLQFGIIGMCIALYFMFRARG
jgi:hypothetical protein